MSASATRGGHKKCWAGVCEIYGYIDQVDDGQSQYAVKTGNRSKKTLFSAPFRRKRISAFFWALYLGCYEPYKVDIWGNILRSGHG